MRCKILIGAFGTTALCVQPGISTAQLSQGCVSLSGTAVQRGMVQAADDGYAFTGWWSSGGLGFVDYEILKIDANGTFQWGEHFDGGQVEYATCIANATDGGFVIGGYTTSYGQGGNDMMLVKVDASGSFQWARTVGTSNAEFGFGLTGTSDGGYAITGSLNHPLGQNNVYVARLDDQGAFLWGREYQMGGTTTGEAHSIAEAPDGSLLVAGFLLGPNGGFLMKLDATGQLVWCKKTVDGAAFYAVGNSLDGNYVVAGGYYAAVIGAGGFDMCVMKVDPNGDAIWDAVIGTSRDDQAWAVTATSDGGFVIGGDWNYNDQDTIQPYIAKVDGNGQLLWTRLFGNGVYGTARSVVQTSDGGLALGGRGAGSAGMILVKMDGQGLACPLCGVNSAGTTSAGAALADLTASLTVTNAGAGGSGTPTIIPIGSASPICSVVGIDDQASASQMITIAPQPMGTSVQVTLPQEWLNNGPMDFVVFDGLGRQVRGIRLPSASFTLERQGLPAGLYHYHVIARGTPLAAGALAVE